MKKNINDIYTQCEDLTADELLTLIDNLQMLADLKEKDEEEEENWNLRHTEPDDCYTPKI